MAYDSEYDTPKAAYEPSVYDQLSKFTAEIRERLESQRSEADHLEERARFARRQASETQTVYETLAKLHESMANKPKDTDPSMTITAPKDWRVS